MLWALFADSAFSAVLTSIRPLAFIAAAVADGILPVDVLLPATASPHDYSLRPSDLRRLRAAELVIWIGPELESFLPQPLQSLEAPQLQLSQAAAIRPLLKLNGTVTAVHPREETRNGTVVAETSAPCCGHHQGYDVHLWLSPAIARQIAREIQRFLFKTHPQYRDRLIANLARFEQQLNQVEPLIHRRLALLHQRSYFVFHDAYRYFESYFGLQQQGYFTINPVLAPGAQRLQQIRQQLRQPGVVCLFTEPQFKPRIVESIARGTQARVGLLDPLGAEIPVDRESYVHFLRQLAQQFADCLQESPRMRSSRSAEREASPG